VNILLYSCHILNWSDVTAVLNKLDYFKFWTLNISLDLVTAPSYLADELEYAANFEAHRRLRSASSLNVHCIQLSTIGKSLSLLPVLGTVCHNTSCPHPLYLLSEVASRLSSSGVPSHDFNCNCCGACTVTVVIFWHFNRSFLLAYRYLLSSAVFQERSLSWNARCKSAAVFSSSLLALLVQENSELQRRDRNEWQQIFLHLLQTLRCGITQCIDMGLLSEQEKEMFFMSGMYVTETSTSHTHTRGEVHRH